MKHLTKTELLQQLRYAANVRRKASSAPFTGMAILGNYILWKTEGWGQKRLAKYNAKVAEYYSAEPDVQKLSNRLNHKADFTIEVVYHSENDNRYQKSKKYRYSMEQKLMDAEDEINRCSQKYLLIHFNVLMDMGYGKARLTRIKDAMNEKLKENSDPMGTGAMEMRRELMDGVGICIEMPA